MRTNEMYTEKQKSEFCELAAEIGIGKTIRELGYPSYPSAIMWLKGRGVVPNVDHVMQQAKLWHTFYTVEDLLEIVDSSLSTVQELMADCTDADGAKKLADSVRVLVNTRLLLEGKSTSINEKRETTQQDLEIAELLRAQQAKDKVEFSHTNPPVDNAITVVRRAGVDKEHNPI